MAIGDLDSIRASLPDLLSQRELQILEMAALGLTNVEIARRLSVSIHVIKFHLASVYRKLDVANRTEAAVTLMHWRERELSGIRPALD